MRKVEHRLRLDLLRGGNQGYIRVKRGENGARRLAIALYMHSVPYMADAGTTAVFRAIKPDNTKLFNSATITDNVVTVGLTTQTVAALGTVRCELSIYGTNNELLYSPQFDIIVEDYLYSDTAVESTSEYTELTEAISNVNNIVSTEAARVAAENQRVANETARVSAEAERASAETARAEAETARATAETERASAETTRASAESSRAFSENIRKQAEKQRVSSETQRDTAETARSTAESGRRSAETARVQEFNAIKADAQDAATAEATRATNEAARVAAETNRVNAEQLRVALYNLWNNATASAYDSLSPSVTLSNKDGHKHFNFGIPSNSRERDEIEAGELESTALNFKGFTFYNIWEPDLVWDANISSYGLPSGINKSFVLITGPAEITEDGNIDHSWDVPQTIFDGQNIYIRRLGVSHEGLGSEDDPLVVSYYNKDWEPVGGTADAVTYTPQTLTTEQQKQARTNIGAGQPVFAVNVTEVSDGGGYTADKTAAEIEAAYQAGRTIVCRWAVPSSIPAELPLVSRTQERVFNFAVDHLGQKEIFTIIVNISDSGVEASMGITNIYEKPADGIPKTDLAQSVQTSLAKADTSISYDSQTLTEAQQAQARANIGAGQPVFAVNLTEVEIDNYTADKTAAEIEAAYQAGRTIVCRMNGLFTGTYIPIELPLLSRLQERVFYFGAEQLSRQSSGKRLDRLSVQISDSGVNVSADVAQIYEKSDYGIPKSDLAADVQTSLAKADAAISLGLTAATPGQIIKVKTVQDGKPTEWEAVDMPGGDKWEKIKEITIAEGAEESNALTINADENGNTFRLKKARLCAKFPAYSGTSTIPSFSFAMLNGKTTGEIAPLLYTSVWPKISTSGISGTIYYVDVSGAQQIEHAQVSTSSIWSNDASNAYNRYGSSSDQRKTMYGDTLWAKPITSIGGSGMLIYPGCHFVLYGVRE